MTGKIGMTGRMGVRGGYALTLTLSTLLGACTFSDPIVGHPPGTGGQVGGIGGAPGRGIGGRVGGVGGQVDGTGGQVDGIGGQVDGTGGQVGGIGGQVGGIGGEVGGIGGQVDGIGGQVGGNCAQVASLFDCQARFDCYAVFFDSGTCECDTPGCCAHFHHCADGFQATCAGLVTCAVLPPHCDSPYLISYRNGCYEGCVQYQDCAP